MIKMAAEKTVRTTKLQSCQTCYYVRLSPRHLTERAGRSGSSCQGQHHQSVITGSGRRVWGGGQGFHVFLTRIKLTSEINKHFIPHFQTMGWVQMKLRGEHDSSTSQPPVPTAVSRCQLNSAWVAFSLSLSDTNSLWCALIKYQQNVH